LDFLGNKFGFFTKKLTKGKNKWDFQKNKFIISSTFTKVKTSNDVALFEFFPKTSPDFFRKQVLIFQKTILHFSENNSRFFEERIPDFSKNNSRF
jgi:hypothetical protein